MWRTKTLTMHRNKESKLGDWQPSKPKTLRSIVWYAICRVSNKMEPDTLLVLTIVLTSIITSSITLLTDHFVLRLVIGLFR